MSNPSITESDLLSDETLEPFSSVLETHSVIPWQCNLQDYFENLLNQESLYRPDPIRFSRQTDITPRMRSILLDWMMEVCTNFFFKRETYYLSLSTLDRYISKKTITQSDFQLIGVTCIFIACKREEIIPRSIKELASTTADAFTVNEIKSTENLILQSLQWQLYPSTYYDWLNAMLEAWDSFILFEFQSITNSSLYNQEKLNSILITFKQHNKQSYIRFVECMELLDICTLDYNIYKYFPVKLISAIIYIMVNRFFAQSNYEILPNRDEFLEEYSGAFIVEKLLSQFLLSTVRIALIEHLVPAIEFISGFRNFPFQQGAEMWANVDAFKNYAEFLSFQTRNPANMDFILMIGRDAE